MHWKSKLKDGESAMGSMTAVRGGFLCLFALAGCVKPAPHVEAAQRILEEFGEEMAEEYHLLFQGSGGSMPETIDEMEVLFAAKRKGTVEEAREIGLSGTKKLLQKINCDERIRPYLKEFPFPASNISLSISYTLDGKSRYEDSSIALAFKAGNEIFYYTMDSRHKKLQMLFSESCENALK